jgi:hypothetical protein
VNHRRRLGALASALVTLALAAALVAPAPASAMSWVLALPPLKTPPPAADTTPRALVESTLDRSAPITRWRAGQTFTSGAACEDQRLAALKRFDDAVNAAGDGTPSAETLQRLTQLGESAYGRCVPGFAFGGTAGGRAAND